MDPRDLYAVGYGLALVGVLATAGSVLLAGSPIGVMMFVAAIPLVLGLVTAFREEHPDRERSLAYRLGNWAGAVFVVGLGLLMVGVGIVSFSTFG